MKAIDVLVENIQCSEKVLDLIKTAKQQNLVKRVVYLIVNVNARVMVITNVGTMTID